MRCPKCHYLSFDPEPRCRNCGYGLSLEADDLLIRDETDVPASPFADVNLRPASVEPAPSRPPVAAVPSPAQPARAVSAFASIVNGSEPVIAGDVTPEERAAVHLPSPLHARPAPTTELPLFVKGMSGTAAAQARLIDEPPVQLAEEPRPPLAVRRKIQDPPVSKSVRPAGVPGPRTKGPLDRDLLADVHRTDALSELENRARRAAAPLAASPLSPVGAGPRLTAAAIDGALLGSLSVAVMWLTLRWCGLPLDRALMLPVLIPTSAFLSLLGVGYLVVFNAAGGQTIGKMAVGLRVVREITPFDAGGPVSFGQAILRAVLTLPSVMIAGAGFVPALIGEERAVHDRLAHTRVIRA
jgi:uncharacterized RDD family membrane protein YckC